MVKIKRENKKNDKLVFRIVGRSMRDNRTQRPVNTCKVIDALKPRQLVSLALSNNTRVKDHERALLENPFAGVQGRTWYAVDACATNATSSTADSSPRTSPC